MIKYVAFVNPVTLTGLPPHINNSLAAWDAGKHGELVKLERIGSLFVVLSVKDEAWLIPMENVISIRMDAADVPTLYQPAERPIAKPAHLGRVPA